MTSKALAARKGKRGRTHQIEVDAVIDQVVHVWCRALRRAEIHTIYFADVFDLLPRARQSHDPRMELGQVGLQYPRGVAGRVAGDEKREERGAGVPQPPGAQVWGAWRGWKGNRRLLQRDVGKGGGRYPSRRACRDSVDDFGQLVQLLWAYVGAVCEAKIDLNGL